MNKNNLKKARNEGEMKMKKKKVVMVVLVASFLFNLLTACANDYNNANCEAVTYYDLEEEPFYEVTQQNEGVEQNTEELEAMDMESEMKDFNRDELEAMDMESKMEDFNTEEYNAIVENRYMSVQNNPLSTFSADVDTASYSNVRRMINDGQIVTPDAVRLEEMINYFKYDYKRPTGEDPFSVTPELVDCPWNSQSKLLSIGINAKDIDYSEMPDSNLVFLIDVSGSMSDEDKLPLLITAFSLLTENLSHNDRVSIVTYAGADSVVLEGAKGSEKDTIISALENLTASGSTNGADGINTAYKLANEYFIEDGNNRVILATDGDLNVGITSEGDLTLLVEEKRESGVFLSVLGFGVGNIKDNKMEALADNGNGNYGYIDSVLEAKKILMEEMGGTLFTVAKDVKFQVEFNPAIVKGYRLIGYENRLLNEEDFNDDTKDAGEIGAGHRLMAMYEIVLLNSEIEIPESDLKYQREKDTVFSSEWLTVNIRYKEPDAEESILLSFPVSEEQYTETPSENVLFATSVVEFGMLLRDSTYIGSANYDSIIETLGDLDCVEQDVYKDEFYSLVKKYARMVD